MTMPQTVPVLTAEHICRKRFNGPDGMHCLRGWRIAVFDNVTSRTVDAVLLEECGGIYPIIFNGNSRNSKAKIAAVWNRAMDRLGYDVENASGVYRGC